MEDVLNMGHTVLELIAVLGFLLVVHWSMPLALVVASIPGVLLLLVVKGRAIAACDARLPQQREADYVYRILFDRQVVKEVRMRAGTF